MRDAVVLAMLVVGFGTFVTAHLVLVVALVWRGRPRWRGLAALVLPPLAAMWGWQLGKKVTVVSWALALVTYAVGLGIAELGG